MASLAGGLETENLDDVDAPQKPPVPNDRFITKAPEQGRALALYNSIHAGRRRADTENRTRSVARGLYGPTASHAAAVNIFHGCRC
jgi:hypothetical protein